MELISSALIQEHCPPQAPSPLRSPPLVPSRLPAHSRVHLRVPLCTAPHRDRISDLHACSHIPVQRCILHHASRPHHVQCMYHLDQRFATTSSLRALQSLPRTSALSRITMTAAGVLAFGSLHAVSHCMEREGKGRIMPLMYINMPPPYTRPIRLLHPCRSVFQIQ